MTRALITVASYTANTFAPWGSWQFSHAKLEAERMARNDASHALLHGPNRKSWCLSASNELFHGDVPCGDGSNKPKGISNAVIIIAAALILASGICTPALAEWSTGKAPSAGIFDGDIREAINELREVRKANQEVAAESREWRGLFSRLDGKFLDRVGNLVWLVFWVLIVALGSWALRELASVAKAAGEALKAFRREESE